MNPFLSCDFVDGFLGGGFFGYNVTARVTGALVKKSYIFHLLSRFNVLIYQYRKSFGEDGRQTMKGANKQRSLPLYEAILQLKNMDECCRFFDDLCTPGELRSMEQRYDVATYLLQNQVYLEILEKTGASSATISRVRRNILDNQSGGMMREMILRQGLAKEDE